MNVNADANIGDIKTSSELRIPVRTGYITCCVELLYGVVLQATQSDRYGCTYIRDDVDRQTGMESELCAERI